MDGLKMLLDVVWGDEEITLVVRDIVEAVKIANTAGERILKTGLVYAVHPPIEWNGKMLVKMKLLNGGENAKR